MTVQIIEKDGRPEWAIVPYETYQQLVQDAEMLQDVCDYDEAHKAIAEGEELVPADVVYAILDGESPIRVWREYRGLSQQKVAEQAGISVSYLSQIESGRRKGSTAVLAALARVLGVTLDDIMDEEAIGADKP
jgi:DNA-binding XRE family transcriptional regulator